MKNIETTSVDTGLHRTNVELYFDRLRMAAALVAEKQRDDLVFKNCQLEADESVVRKERVYDSPPPGVARTRIGTWHHSVVILTKRGSTQQLLYMCRPKFVAVDKRGKPGPPALPTNEFAVHLLSKHLGGFVVLHTDGAQAYSCACERLRQEGWRVLHDSVIHSDHQYTAFGRHDLSGVAEWEQCTMVMVGQNGERRICVSKGCQKAEGAWRHLKHGNAAIPEEVHNDDNR